MIHVELASFIHLGQNFCGCTLIYSLFRNAMDLTCHLIRLIHVLQREVDLLKFITCPRRLVSILNLKFDDFHSKRNNLLLYMINFCVTAEEE